MRHLHEAPGPVRPPSPTFKSLQPHAQLPVCFGHNRKIHSHGNCSANAVGATSHRMFRGGTAGVQGGTRRVRGLNLEREARASPERESRSPERDPEREARARSPSAKPERDRGACCAERCTRTRDSRSRATPRPGRPGGSTSELGVSTSDPLHGRRDRSRSTATSDGSSQVARARGRSRGDDVDIDSSVELDGSEAIRGRLTPPSTSPPLSRSVEARSTGSVDVHRRWWAQRRTLPSTPGSRSLRASSSAPRSERRAAAIALR
jgi:hypothetical protein